MPRGRFITSHSRRLARATLTTAQATLEQPGLEAVILASPTQVHAQQAEEAMRAGMHVLIEIPIADSVADSECIVQVQEETGVVAMAGHVRRFNPSQQWIHQRIEAGELMVQQMDVQTYFFRRSNMNAAGQPRTWTDHLLWHHACHTVDLFMHQTGEEPVIANAIQGPLHPDLEIALDMNIQLQVPSGAILTLSLSFNHEGPSPHSSATSATMGLTKPCTTISSMGATNRSTSPG